MRDKRPVDELSIEELERVLAVKKREQRQHKVARMQRYGRVVQETAAAPVTPNAPAPVVGKQHPPEAAILQARSAPAALTPALESYRASDAASMPYFEDAPAPLPDDPEKNRFWKRFINQALFLVEVSAVLGLIYIAVMFFQSRDQLLSETAEAQRMANEQRIAALPTIAPTPQISIEQVVLPGGHTPPTSPGGAQFNLNEIPDNLLPVLQGQIFAPAISRPQRTPETALALIIPKLNINQSIVQGTDWEALKQGVGQLINGVNPGDTQGNLVLSGHNDIYGEVFRYLDQLEEGDMFQIQTQSRIYTYVITGWDIYDPSDVHVLNERGGASATLISCWPYQVSDRRIVVFAERVDT